jgi:DNA-binding NarL/FixJ family response regulator
MTIRVLIADDHPVFRFGMKALLSTEADMKIVGEASDGRETMKLAADLKPDVILMDINMPEVNGIEATRQIVRAHPGIAILMVTMLDDDSLFSAMRAGARGYLLKGAEGEETLRAIRAAAAGEAIFSPRVAERLIHYFDNSSAAQSKEPFPDLTPREREILDLIAQGLTNHAIAERLVLSPKTVRNQVSTIFSKLEVASRGEAIVKARNSHLNS